MGQCVCTENKVDKEDRLRSRNIDRMARRMAMEEAKARKVLLLGTGESGKSTLFKQAKILYNGGFDDLDRKGYRHVISANIFDGIIKLVKAVDEDVFEDNPQLLQSRNAILSIHDFYILPTVISEDLARHIQSIWGIPQVKAQYHSNRSKLQVQDSVNIFLDKIDQIASPSWKPSDQDILYARRPTTGASEMVFTMKSGSSKIRLIDVGGQRSERRKWIHQFSHCNAILFVVAISEFDQNVFEDESTNRLRESFVLFDQICNSKWFASKDLILFLNKRDMLKRKLKEGISVKTHFPEFNGESDFKSAVQFFILEFGKRNKNPERNIYTHVTCATDTKTMENVFDDIRDIILNAALDSLL